MSFLQLLQRYELFLNCANKLQLNSVFFPLFFEQLLTYNLLTFDIYISENLKRKFYIIYIIKYNIYNVIIIIV